MCCFNFAQYNCLKSILWTLKLLFCINFMIKEPYLKFPKFATTIFGLKMTALLWHFSKNPSDLVAGSFPYFHILWSYNLVPAKNTHSDIRVPVNLFNFSCIVSKYSLLNSSLELFRKHQQTSSWKTSVAKVLNKYALYLIHKQDHVRWM